MALEGSWHIPGAGPIRKPYVIAGVLVVGVAVWWKRSHPSSSPSSTATAAGPSSAAAGSDPYPWDGTIGNPQDPYSQDPATGQTYGNEALAAGTFSGSVGGGGGGGDSSGSASSGPPFASNSAWEAYVSAYMINTENRNPTTVGEVLGAYLTGAQIQAADVPLVRDAIGIGGAPPVSGPQGFPPAINVTGSTGGGGGGQLKAPTGLQSSGITGSHANLSWKSVSQATGYEVHVWAGKDSHTRTTTTTSTAVGPLKRHTQYHWQVRATDSAGPGAWSTQASFKTK